MSGEMSAGETTEPLAPLKVPPELVPALRCPGSPNIRLNHEGAWLKADCVEPFADFPILGGTPILINEANSVFRITDFTEAAGVTTMDLREEAQRLDTPLKKLKQVVQRLFPDKSRSVTDFSAKDASDCILAENPEAKLLVIGAGDSRFISANDACVVYTDVALAPDTNIVADAHDIPFADATFDAVFAIAVLEHVVDPYRCCAEIRRVLKPRGYVYAVTPFMQQVHMGAYDFTRFTALGHRRLFRWFDEERAGIANGPGMVVAWSVEYMLASMCERPAMRSLVRSFSRLFTWPFLAFDGWLSRKPGTYDCASAFYFFGRLRDLPVGDRDIIGTYKGMN